jgi:hypothetical protein
MTAYDKTSEAITAIKEYESHKQIIANTSERIKEQYADMVSLPSTKTDGMPRTRNPHAGEEHLVAALDRLNSMEKRYRNSVVFIEWFEPMWYALTKEERSLLETYRYSNTHEGALAEIASDYNYSLRQLRRIRQKALSRFTFLLFGC